MLIILALILVPLSAFAQAYSVLYNFGTQSGDPGHPGNPGIIAQGRDGDLYSTTWADGAYGHGSVFKISTSGKLTVLHSFNLNVDGSAPNSGLTLGTDGNFYGTTSEGGSLGNGTVFRISPTGKLTTLYSFTGSADGADPYAAPIQGEDGNFYGTTASGGLGFGTIYKMTPSGAVTSLFQFDQTNGAYSQTPLILATDGNFYGTTTAGGLYNLGAVFKITSAGTLTLLYSADYTNTVTIEAPLVQGSDGNFYATTVIGDQNFGVVFKMTPSGSVTILHDFNGTTDGGNPFAGLIQATNGDFYGTTNLYGRGGSNAGTFYRITSKGAFSVVHTFNGTDGASSYVTPIQHTNGIFYGDTDAGGTHGQGVFYSVNASLKPFVGLVSPAGTVGQSIGILGQGFVGVTSVSFNGKAATFKVVSGTYLTARVPKGATTGFVTVTTPSGVLQSNRSFQVRP
jgi:uncharacterized repeat protein (TIGR03803 family)